MSDPHHIFDIISKHIDAFSFQHHIEGSHDHLFMSVLDAIDSIIFVKDVDGKHLFVNRAYEVETGINRQQVIGKTDADIFSFDEKTRDHIINTDKKLIKNAETIKIEEEIRVKDGSLSWFLTTKAAITDRDNKVIALAGSATNISEQKRLEQELLKANREKTEFLAQLSHEIRTPLNAISGLAEITQNEFQQVQASIESSDNANSTLASQGYHGVFRYIDDIAETTEHLSLVIEDILDATNFEINALTLNEKVFNLGYTFEQLQKVVATINRKNDVNVKFTSLTPIDYYLLGDESKLFQVIINLINNAIKFTEQGEINITFSCEGEKDNVQLNVCVTDTGVGIAKAEQDKIFDAFYQSDQNERHFGSGIGLSVASRIIDKMGGKLSVDSDIGQGSRFSFKLSFAKKNAPSSAHNICERQRFQGKKALVVDDLEMNIVVPSYFLNNLNFDVMSAQSGEQAIELCHQHQFDIILTDLRMPGMNGLETAKKIKADNRNSSTPIIAVSANLSMTDKLECLSAGICDSLAKPLKADDLTALVDKYFPKA
ncbi:response regulator [Thalassotalea sp. HSM 43]|uniref:ATP-binding protein n=1 Tax=Thalassotalea sp. HSM 43 TaxID=2552945 RepID=UPI00107FDA53|nr:ATP-binding protein [Thalassotalea sp. HSM 43]QBY03038.1 response regulator [Thalassotalea sp. HSM 43]